MRVKAVNTDVKCAVKLIIVEPKIIEIWNTMNFWQQPARKNLGLSLNHGQNKIQMPNKHTKSFIINIGLKENCIMTTTNQTEPTPYFTIVNGKWCVENQPVGLSNYVEKQLFDSFVRKHKFNSPARPQTESKYPDWAVLLSGWKRKKVA